MTRCISLSVAVAVLVLAGELGRVALALCSAGVLAAVWRRAYWCGRRAGFDAAGALILRDPGAI